MTVLTLDWFLEDAKVIQVAQADGVSAVLRGLPIAIVMMLIAAQAVWEMAKLCGSAGVLILGRSAVIGAAGLGTLPLWQQFVGGELTGQTVMMLFAAIVWIVFLDQMVSRRTTDAIRTVACTMMTVLYLGVGGAMILQIRVADSNGFVKLIMFLAVVKSTDIGAYFVGSAIGKRKLTPWLSPGKSWEGLFGGLAAAAGVSILIAYLGDVGLAVWQAAVFGVIIGVAGQFGDLCESLLKRSAKIKDSSSMVPEFGGILDIIDSPLIAAPAAAAMFAVM
ncbi:MAG: phosphatidate cytidylyltransferase [Phycisphaerae bacterium]|jgi:phosphatidate cytidylyltransferase|nr:phosphatidate cytidylyltransferase [Phycisphaerae bacterium]